MSRQTHNSLWSIEIFLNSDSFINHNKILYELLELDYV